MYNYFNYEAPSTLHESLLGYTEQCNCQHWDMATDDRLDEYSMALHDGTAYGQERFEPTDCLDEDIAVFYENMGMTVY